MGSLLSASWVKDYGGIFATGFYVCIYIPFYGRDLAKLFLCDKI